MALLAEAGLRTWWVTSKKELQGREWAIWEFVRIPVCIFASTQLAQSCFFVVFSREIDKSQTGLLVENY